VREHSDRIERNVRIREAATRGIRPVPDNPTTTCIPALAGGLVFFARAYACDLRPQRCGDCTAANCNHVLGRPRNTRERRDV
jgi:hypothetical protein